MDEYALIWAIAVLRDDFKYTWDYIGKKLSMNPRRAAYLYDKVKKHYNYEPLHQSNGDCRYDQPTGNTRL